MRVGADVVGQSTPGESIGFDAVTDGTSNTILLAERILQTADSIRPSTHDRYTGLGRGSFYGNIGFSSVAPAPTARGTPRPGFCLAMRSGTDYLDTAGSQDAWRMVGGTWACGRGNIIGFTTTLPPNSASCVRNHVLQPDWGGLISAGAYHTGGANAARVDGSVRFVSDQVDCGTARTITDAEILALVDGTNTDLTYAGPSLWGVWGALGTTSGGEAVSLD